MRTFTPHRKNPDGSTTIFVHRCCNGCYREIGDVTEQEIEDAIDGRPMTDVRHECPWCAPFLAEQSAL